MLVRCVLFFALVVVSQTVHLRAADGPAKNIPELQVLSNYIGTWDVAITSEDSPFKKGESSTTWILDGRFVQQTGVLQSSDGSSIKITTLMTYDSERKTYRMWSFLSNGSTSEGFGKWDEKTRTMTTTGQKEKDGTTTTTTAKFSDNGIEEWLFITTNQNKEVVGRFGGTNTRRKQ